MVGVQPGPPSLIQVIVVAKKLCQSVLLLEQVAELLSINVSNITRSIPYPLKQVVVRLFELMHHF